MTRKPPPVTWELIDDAGLIASLMRMADESDQAVAVLDVIARRDDRIERLGLALREAERALSGEHATISNRIGRLLPEFDDPMARFRDDVHPAVTNARIAVHNAKIMGQLGSEVENDEG
jgi:hypothetical protein